MLALVLFVGIHSFIHLYKAIVMKRYGVFACLLLAVLVGCSTDSKPVAPAAEIAPAAKSTTENTLALDQARAELARQEA